MTADVKAAARSAFAYLAATDPLPAAPTDAVIGFGTFDLALARFCGELHRGGHARRIIFTGGIGAGTADLGRPEADAWAAELFRAFPAIPRDLVILENRSTNTAENIAFTAALLARDFPALAFGTGIRSVLVVASPSRLRRAKLTLQLHQPALHLARRLPPVSFAAESDLYAAKGYDYLAHLRGELDRIVDYPARGWIAAEPLPAEIAAARRTLALPGSAGPANP